MIPISSKLCLAEIKFLIKSVYLCIMASCKAAIGMSEPLIPSKGTCNV